MNNRLGSRRRNGVGSWRVAADIPTLWHAPETTATDRKEIIRLLMERVVVHVRAERRVAKSRSRGRVGSDHAHEIVRSVSRYESLGDYDRMMDRIVQLRRRADDQDRGPAHAEGYRTPRSRKGYTPTSVRQLLSRRGLTGERIGMGRNWLAKEWWLPDLAREPIRSLRWSQAA